jgi:putative phosphotransacetylase
MDTLDSEKLKTLIFQIINKLSAYSLGSLHPEPIPTGISNRHVHLSQPDMEALFGKGYNLACERSLSQPGQCATIDLVTLAGPKGCIGQVRVLGPVRKQTQVEVMRADTFKLGISAPLRELGRLEGSAGVTLVGPRGVVNLAEGLIVAQRHIHMTPGDAALYNVSDGQSVQVKTQGERGLVFDNVVVRVSDKFALDFHIDIEEANSAGLKTGDKVFILTRSPLKNTGVVSISRGEANPVQKPVMLLTEEIVRDAYKHNRHMHAARGCIITPLAKDALRELDMKLEYQL